jgi:hypothetical protein
MHRTGALDSQKSRVIVGSIPPASLAAGAAYSAMMSRTSSRRPADSPLSTTTAQVTEP